MNRLEKLQNRGNLLESLLTKPIYLIRVWGYESRVMPCLYSEEKEDILEEGTEVEKQLLDLSNKIRKEIDKRGWNDNKIVAEIQVGYWRIFIGYWDSHITIGQSLIPNDYLPDYKESEFGGIDPIGICSSYITEAE